MTKNNPLFVDSTKFHGDRIATLVELSDILIYDGESIVALIIDHQGEMSRVPLEPAAAEGVFEAKVWLSHQKQVTCQFLVEKDGRELFHSAAFKARAQYAIIQKWIPVTEDEPLPFEIRLPEQAPSPAGAAEWAMRAEELIEKWDL